MKEKRIARIEVRSDNSKEMVLTGRPVVFNQPTVIGEDYKEVIAEGALDGADLSDVRLLYNHDLSTVPLARTPKTMELSVDPAGLTFTANLPANEYGRTVYEAVKRGDLTGMSFSFKVPDGGDDYDPETNTRTIRKIEKIYECSIVPFPAYPTASVEARDAIKASRNKWQLKQKAKILYNQIMKVRV